MNLRSRLQSLGSRLLCRYLRHRWSPWFRVYAKQDHWNGSQWNGEAWARDARHVLEDRRCRRCGAREERGVQR